MTIATCTCAYHPELTSWHLPSCPLAVGSVRPALLTAEAVRALDEYARRPRCSDWGEGLSIPRLEALLAELLRHYATEGRGALVGRVAEAMYGPFREMDSKLRENAEAVVTALFGERDA